MKVITVTKDDLVDNTVYKNTYKYDFPRGTITFQDHEIALDSVNLFSNWYNITAALGNNVYTYTWIDATVVTVTIPDGIYTIEQFQHYLEWVMISNTHYLIDGSGNYVYYIEWLRNATSRKMQLICYPVPATTTYSLPPGATWVLPGTDTTPQVTILSTNKVDTLTGFPAGTYPASPQATIYTVEGTNNTVFTPFVGINIECQFVYNNLSLPSTLLYTIPVPSVEVGTLISAKPTNYAFSPIKDGQYTDMLVRLTNQIGEDITLQDPNVTISFVVRSKGEMV
jgi:hypothetical protein